MSRFLHACLAVILCIAPACALGQEPDVAAIMERVAANQDRADTERARYTYVQHADVASHKGHKVLCREVTESRVTPTVDGSDQQLLTLNGSLWLDRHYVSYTHPLTSTLQPGETRGITLTDDQNTDVNLVEHMRSNLTNTRAKDGFNAGLFPLTGKAQTGYDYHLVRREPMNGHDTWLIHFKPRNREDFDWEGDAWIDTVAYQPVLVRTHLSRAVPFLVKTMLGTNVPGLGFAVTYAPQPDGVWFPVTFGTEFKIHVLFFFSRQITINIQNRDFQKTHTESHIVDASTD